MSLVVREWFVDGYCLPLTLPIDVDVVKANETGHKISSRVFIRKLRQKNLMHVIIKDDCYPVGENDG